MKPSMTRRRARRAAAGVLPLVAALALLGAAPARRTAKPPARRATAARRPAATLLGRNLIVNGGAESENGGWATGWEPAKTVQSEGYGHTSGEWDWGVTGAPGGEVRYFRLEIPDGAESLAVAQWVSVAAESAVIDSGRARFTLSGWFGGVTDGPGTSALLAAFRDASGKQLASALTPPPVPADLPRPGVGAASLVARETSGAVPAGTRQIGVTLVGRHWEFAACPNCSALAFADRLALEVRRASSRP